MIIIDYAQNLEMPLMRKDQAGDVYYYTPMTVPAFGVVDCNTEKNHLHAYIYPESEGKKGSNDVTSLVMKFLKDKGFLDGTQRLKLSIVCDNCTGQNKNNTVLRLAPYLVECGHFKKVQVVFFVVGHTKVSLVFSSSFITTLYTRSH